MKIVLRRIGIYMLILVFVHNTTYHVSIGWSPTLVFHRREPATALEMRLCRQTLRNIRTGFDFAHEIRDILSDLYAAARDTTLEAYHK